jgi:hypothetical protein
VAIALGLIAATTLVYYWNNYRTCTEHRSMRDRLVAAAAEAAGGPVVLADVVDYDWAKVSILAERDLQGRRVDCPFGWDWSWDERVALARDGDLAVMLFSSGDGVYIDFLDVRRSTLDFAEMPAQYTREAARFEATQTGYDPARYTLSPEFR